MNHFKIVLEKYLTDLAQRDALFAQNFKKENKKIDDCATFVCNQAFALAKERSEMLGKDNQESGFGMSDEDVYALAIHYYDEDTIDVGSKISCGVIVNQKIELTEDEIAQAKQKAIDRIFYEEKDRLAKKNTPNKIIPISEAPAQASLF
jgi:hypothetical protein